MWAKTWSNILEGGPKRWKVDNLEFKKLAMAHIQQHVDVLGDAPLKILCPLAGDDPFVQYAWSQGHDVTAIDLVPAAVDVMRQQFGGSDRDWTRQESEASVIWKHAGGRATLYAGDMTQKRPELKDKFDVVYDKDGFGALPLDLRQSYCQRLSEYCKANAVVYTEVVMHAGGRAVGGPPFHVEKEDLMETNNFGTDFVHVAALGEVYDAEMPDSTQTGHIMKRK